MEDRITKYLKAWMKEWDDDLEHRSDVVKDSSSGAWGQAGGSGLFMW